MGKISMFRLLPESIHFGELPCKVSHACCSYVPRHLFKTLAQSCYTLLHSFDTAMSKNYSDGSAYIAHGRTAVPRGVTGKWCGWPLNIPRLSIQKHAFRIRCAEELDEWLWEVHHSDNTGARFNGLHSSQRGTINKYKNSVDVWFFVPFLSLSKRVATHNRVNSSHAA